MSLQEATEYMNWVVMRAFDGAYSVEEYVDFIMILMFPNYVEV